MVALRGFGVMLHGFAPRTGLLRVWLIAAIAAGVVLALVGLPHVALGAVILALALALWRGGRDLAPSEIAALQQAAKGALLEVSPSGKLRWHGKGAAMAHAPPDLSAWLARLDPSEARALDALIAGAAQDAVQLAAGQGAAVPLEVVRLSAFGAPLCRLWLRPRAPEIELAALRDASDAMVLRQERLLALGSHELRTPAATLQMLAEDLEDGLPWGDVAPDFHASVGQILSVLDDLRAVRGQDGARAARHRFDPESMRLWWHEEFAPHGAAFEIDLALDLPDLGARQLRFDVGRLSLALGKLVRHCLETPELTALRLTLMVTPTDARTAALVWSLTPRTRSEIAPWSDEIFAPFGAGVGAGRGDKLKGVGLYTALKAAESLQGTLVLQPGPQGGSFTLSHPARVTDAEPPLIRSHP